MKTFQAWAESEYDEGMRHWAGAGALAGLMGLGMGWGGLKKPQQPVNPEPAAVKAVDPSATMATSTLKDRSKAIDTSKGEEEGVKFPTLKRTSMPSPKFPATEYTPRTKPKSKASTPYEDESEPATFKAKPKVRVERPILTKSPIADEEESRPTLVADNSPVSREEKTVLMGNHMITPKDGRYYTLGGVAQGERDIVTTIKMARATAINLLLKKLKATNTHLKGDRDEKIYYKKAVVHGQPVTFVFVLVSIPEEGISVHRELEPETGTYRESMSPRTFQSYATYRRRLSR